ncbi:MoxR-like ATPase in aerotolerance operon [hydrothermal vent metagenome]|uniref:MoxR-like ATPase in aerotolerance operon n=1 Tax=hydrothermal vent metagenome TaxID=652676 RepID=A0A3B0VNM6_9ZZZZ
MTIDVQELNEQVGRESALLDLVRREIAKVIVGQNAMIERLLTALLCNSHVLLEGVPGLAKTKAVQTMAQVMQVSFQRLQFTPDLLPGDLIGTLIYNPKSGEFTTRKGPIFANIVLADEINRAPAKVQSALLEAMEEGQVTIGDHSYPLPMPFMVLATQNPIEQEGTYPLPEAQMDRFMLKLKIDYPDKAQEKQILRLMAGGEEPVAVNPLLGMDDITRLRQLTASVYLDEKVEDYIVDLISASRRPADYGLELDDMLQYGASPRATIFLAQAAKATALLAGRGYVTPQDVKTVGLDVLRHRLAITYEAEAEEITPEDIIGRIFDTVAVP